MTTLEKAQELLKLRSELKEYDLEIEGQPDRVDNFIDAVQANITEILTDYLKFKVEYAEPRSINRYTSRGLGWASLPLEVCEHENPIFNCFDCAAAGYDDQTISGRSYAAGLGGPFVLIASSYRAGWDACRRSMNDENEKLKLKQQLEIAIKALGDLKGIVITDYTNDQKPIAPAYRALKEIEAVR